MKFNMKQIHLIAASIFVAAQCIFFVGWSGYEQLRLAPGVGESIVVPVAPVDPRDILRGQYMRLGYEFSRPRSSRMAEGNDLWVLMRRDENDGLYHPVEYSSYKGFSKQAFDDDVVMRGSIDRGRGEFGVDKYYVPEGTPTPNMSDLTVRLRIGHDHRPRIEAVYLNGQPWP